MARQRWTWPESLYRRLRFCPPTVLPTGCIEFTGATDRDGYGRIGIDRRNCLAHRAAYELMIGPIPDGLTLDHLCRNRPCVNVGHLESVPIGVNVQRGEPATKEHCAAGHPYDEENTYRRSSGGRDCRACGVERSRKYRLQREETKK